ncbi:MAG: M48 family metallopeptidase [Flammeovirgaceae bacterium]
MAEEQDPKESQSNEETQKQRVRVYFNNIQSAAWEHPADKVGMRALKTVPGVDTVLRLFLDYIANEHGFKLLALAVAVRVNEKQFPRLYKLHLEACKVLNMETIPELFVTQNPMYNAGAMGIKDPCILINSSMINDLTDDELLFVIGHELGHIKSEHMLYRTLFFFLDLMMKNSHRLPFPKIALGTLMGVFYALLEWSRKSELSCDRAGLLVVQDPEVAVQLVMKLAGGKKLEEMDLGEFMRQAEEYNEKGTVNDNLMKILHLVSQTHPFPVIRVYELMQWIRSGEYENIIRGYYSNEEDTTLGEDAEKAANSYKKGFRQTFKPIEDMMNDIKDNVQKGAMSGKNPWEIFDDLMKKGRKKEAEEKED